MEAKASVQDIISNIALEYTRDNTCPAETYMPESARDRACLGNPDITCDKCHRYAADKLAGEILDKLRPHLVEDTGHIMPEGMEWLLEVWPKWSNGEYCKFGDWWTADKYGDYKPKQLRRLVFYTPEQLREWEQDEGDNFGYEWDFMRPSDTTYRPDKAEPPAPKVLDSEGVECNVGDAVWWVHNKTGDFRIIRIDKYGKCAIHDDDADEPCGMTVPSTELTHRRPMFDADGEEIRVGDTVYLLPGEWCDKSPLYRCNGWDEMEVINISPVHNSDRIECKTLAKAIVCYPQPSQLTHRAPVIAADGKPLREGETVWCVASDSDLESVGITVSKEEVTGKLTIREIYEDMLRFEETNFVLPPVYLSHEQPDSWERLE